MVRLAGPPLCSSSMMPRQQAAAANGHNPVAVRLATARPQIGERADCYTTHRAPHRDGASYAPRCHKGLSGNITPPARAFGLVPPLPARGTGRQAGPGRPSRRPCLSFTRPTSAPSSTPRPHRRDVPGVANRQSGSRAQAPRRPHSTAIRRPAERNTTRQRHRVYPFLSPLAEEMDGRRRGEKTPTPVKNEVFRWWKSILFRFRILNPEKTKASGWISITTIVQIS